MLYRLYGLGAAVLYYAAPYPVFDRYLALGERLAVLGLLRHHP
jgi:hypothetical protein